MTAMNMSAAEQIYVEFDQCLENIGGARHDITRLQFLVWHWQKTMVCAKDAELSLASIEKMMRGQLNLSGRNLRRAVQTDSSDARIAMKKLGLLEMFKELFLALAAWGSVLFLTLDLGQQSQRIGMSQQVVFEIFIVTSMSSESTSSVTVAWNGEHLAKIEIIYKTSDRSELFFTAIPG